MYTDNKGNSLVSAFNKFYYLYKRTKGVKDVVMTNDAIKVLVTDDTLFDTLPKTYDGYSVKVVYSV